MRYKVGEPVIRKDDPQNRFYVPVSRSEDLPGVDSQIVLRVASDAFKNEEDAVKFGKHVEQALNEDFSELRNAFSEMKKWAEECEDAKTWGGPTMLPKFPFSNKEIIDLVNKTLKRIG